MKVGFGYDFHKLVKGRPLILGGIKIPYDKGLLGHSDGDVLVHAVGDAILGASGERDIGTHFPDNDPRYKDISSLILLKEIMKITGAKIINIDSVIICEAPKLLGYILTMEEKLAKTLNIPVKFISIKAKTNEGVGIIGRGEGIAVYAVVLIKN
ncbi:2-C-methyl-D-erythritol 2,4-cyclodiphosphate synthase [candidate division WOR-3 bacterium]|nr:2-C-methyl-D-erythritol 2,4-cyclodiphosphate synthase [candidate division WOR-3 bacterium]